MNRLSSLLAIDNVALDIDVTSRKRVFEEASLLIEKASGVSHAEVFEALIAREKIGSTCLTGNVAIPHGRVEGLSDVTLVILRTTALIDFESAEKRRAKLFYVLMIPEGHDYDYQDTLAELHQLALDPAVLDRIMKAETPVEVCETIGEWKPEVQAVDETGYPTEAEITANEEGTDKTEEIPDLAAPVSTTINIPGL